MFNNGIISSTTSPLAQAVHAELSGDTRRHCRNPRCRSKLPAPTDNDRRAFCCSTCFEQFYRTRCLICEAALPPGPINRKICRRAGCRTEWRKNRWNYVPATLLAEHAERPLRSPIKSGVKTGLKPCRASCIVGPADPPINLLGTYLFPTAVRLDPGLAAKIKTVEIGGVP